MKSDAVVVGAELEAFVAALRFAERGLQVRLLMPGAGSLHYAMGGLSILGGAPEFGARSVQDPFAPIATLPDRHPLRIVGADRTRRHVGWFLDLLRAEGPQWQANEANVSAITMAGQVRPVFAFPNALAILEGLRETPIAIVAFDGFRDFAARLCMAGLRRLGLEVCLVRAGASEIVGDSVRLARAFDDANERRRILSDLRPLLPAGVRVVLFPACLGVEHHEEAARTAEEALGVPVLEVPTLPPSVPGLRLHRVLLRALQKRGVDVHPGVRGISVERRQGRCRRMVDRDGHGYEAAAFVAATGGVMMGGLDVDSRGMIREPIFDGAVHQTAPFERLGAPAIADALHRAGVEIDDAFRPCVDGTTLENVFVCGALLAHSNPVEEGSGDGISIATACEAADHALALMGAR